MTSMKSFFPVLLVSICLLTTISCEENTNQVDEHAPEVILSGDSILVEDSDEPTETIQAELLGKWSLQSTTIGQEVIPIEEEQSSSIEFRQDGTMVSESDGLPTEMFAFVQVENLLSCSMWDQDQKIIRLTADELLLAEEIDGQSVQYLYKKGQ